MFFKHRDLQPVIDPKASVAPTAVVSGDVTIGAGCRILHGAVLTSEGGPIVLGSDCIVMENAVLRGTERHPLTIGSDVLVGPRAYLSGCTVEDSVFIATGSSIFNGAVLRKGSEVRINGTVHLLTELLEGATVPIGWVAVGRPASIFPPGAHEEIWAIQKMLNFKGEVFGGLRMPDLPRAYSRFLAEHDVDVELD